MTQPEFELRPVHPDLPNCFAVFVNGEDMGDIEQLVDGTWEGDITAGNGPPSKPFATQAEAVQYVLNPTG